MGDIVGTVGLKSFIFALPNITKKFSIDFTIVNGENISGGLGITPKHASQLFAAGVNVITSGNHIWHKKEIIEFLETQNRLLRPANYPEGAPGSGSCVVTLPNNISVGVINVLGRVFMQPLDCPFKAVQKEIAKIGSNVKIIIVDIHAEATAEKVAMGLYLDGEVSAVVGTHTHVQTADEKILNNGTAYITDLGMTGPHDSVIGVNKEIIIEKFLRQLPKRFDTAKNGLRINGVIVKVDKKTGKAKNIFRLDMSG